MTLQYSAQEKPLELKHFTHEMPGRLQPIAMGDHVFVPNPLPPHWEMPQRLLEMIARINPAANAAA